MTPHFTVTLQRAASGDEYEITLIVAGRAWTVSRVSHTAGIEPAKERMACVYRAGHPGSEIAGFKSEGARTRI